MGLHSYIKVQIRKLFKQCLVCMQKENVFTSYPTHIKLQEKMLLTVSVVNIQVAIFQFYIIWDRKFDKVVFRYCIYQ